MALRVTAVLLMLATALVFRAPAVTSEAIAPPVTDQAVVATLVAGDVSLTGSGFGTAATGSLYVSYEGTTIVMAGTSSNVSQWADDAITFTLPQEARSGTLTIVAEGVASAPIELLVYEYTSHSLETSGPNGHPLALAVDGAGTLWVNEEFHRQFKALTNGDLPALSSWTVPESDAGIYVFAPTEQRTQVTSLGEDVDIAADGSVWFTEGGGYLYDGAQMNASRIMRFDPSTEAFSCYNVASDHAEVVGLALDESRGLVWYAESGMWDGNAISAFAIADATSDCDWNPDVDAWPAICDAQPVPGCHTRYVLPREKASPSHLVLDANGNVWFTEFWANRVGRLDPETGALTELPLPAPIVRQGPGIFAGSGVWEIDIDTNGMLWVSETFDATVDRIDPARMSDADCTALDTSGTNPCIDEMFVGTDGYDGAELHTVTLGREGRVWFGLGRTAGGGRIGFIDTRHDDQVVLLPPITVTEGVLGGVAEDPVTGDVWFAEFLDNSIGRMQLASGDADGVPGALDNCPDAYNPGQENNDRDLVSLRIYDWPYDDLTWPDSDESGDACDADMDNDGLSNQAEASLPGAYCPAATAPTAPDIRDTDGDYALDGAECLLGTDPASATSRPPAIASNDPDRDGLPSGVEIAIGSSPSAPDSDGDGFNDGIEVRYYGSNPLVRDTDGDGCDDPQEIASINADRHVTAIDIGQVARSYGLPNRPGYMWYFDVNRDEKISSIDLTLLAQAMKRCD
jgi:streptogramin lyase